MLFPSLGLNHTACVETGASLHSTRLIITEMAHSAEKSLPICCRKDRGEVRQVMDEASLPPMRAVPLARGSGRESIRRILSQDDQSAISPTTFVRTRDEKSSL